MKTKKPNTQVLILLTAFASVAAVLYTPALPQIIRYFHISASSAQLTMIWFMIAYAIGPLIYGPLQHRHGRKPTLYIGMVVGAFGMLLAIAANDSHLFFLLVIGRAVEGLGTSVGIVVSLTIVYDYYRDNEMRKVLSYTTLAFALLPGIAIFIGGLLAKYFPWVSCFYFLLGYTVFLFCMSLRLPETSPGLDKSALQLNTIIENYRKVSTDSKLICYALQWGCSTAIIYLFAAYTPFIVINQFGINPEIFGLINLLSIVGLILGNLTSAWLVSFISARQTIFLGIILSTLGCTIFATAYILSILNVTLLYGAILICYLGLPMIISNSSALANQHISKDAKATASAFISALNLGVSVFFLFFSALFHKDFSLVLLCLFFILLVMKYSLFYLTRHKFLIKSPGQEQIIKQHFKRKA
jgi:MFS family permease